MSNTSTLSTAEARRPIVTESALRAFAAGGYHGTTVADVARDAGISPAYVFKLFPGKETLFASALELCFTRVSRALEIGADAALDRTPIGILDAMGGAYAELLRDRALLRLQVHALAVADVPEIGAALRAGLARVTLLAKQRSDAPDDDVQRFIAFGQLCHLIAMTHSDDETADWARIVAAGIRHPG
jgi:AcrR family transcriptional regulator